MHTGKEGLRANFGIGIAFPTRSSSLATSAPVLMSNGTSPGTLGVSQTDEFLDRMFVMTQVSNVDLQKRFPVIQIDSMCQVASICRSLAWSVDLESLLFDWKRVKMFHYNSTPLLELKFARVIQIYHSFFYDVRNEHGDAAQCEVHMRQKKKYISS